MSEPSRPLRVLCLGGGFVAVSLTRALRGAIRRGDVELTVVDRDNHLTFHGFIPEVLAGRIQPSQITVPARRAFRHARFHQGEVERIDVDRRVVVTSRALDGRTCELQYDELVLGLGSRDDLTRFDGLAEHAHVVHRYVDCYRTRAHLVSCLEMAETERDAAERRRLLTFVFAGGNYGGVEMATEFLDSCRAVAGSYPGIEQDDVRVVLVHPGDRVLPELGEEHRWLRGRADRYLAGSGIDVRLGRRVVAATASEVTLDDGERIPTRTVVSSTGTDLPAVLADLDGERDARGRLVTDADGRVQGLDGVWAGGDNAAFPHPHGGTCPPLALYARAAGRHIGRCIARQVRGRAAPRFRFTGVGDLVVIGRHRAIGHLRGLPIAGFPAWLVWRMTLLMFLPSLERKLRTVLDWAFAPFTGPELSAGAVLPHGEPAITRRPARAAVPHQLPPVVALHPETSAHPDRVHADRRDADPVEDLA